MGLIGLIEPITPISPIHDTTGKKKKVGPGNERASNFILPSILLDNPRERCLSGMGLVSPIRLISPIPDKQKQCEVWKLLYHSMSPQKGISLLLIAGALSGQKRNVGSRSGRIKKELLYVSGALKPEHGFRQVSFQTAPAACRSLLMIIRSLPCCCAVDFK